MLDEVVGAEPSLAVSEGAEDMVERWNCRRERGVIDFGAVCVKMNLADFMRLLRLFGVGSVCWWS